jgi:hypothetical protein
MGRTGWIAAAVLALLGGVPALAGQDARVDFGANRASADAHYVAQWVLESGDHRGRPFAIVDKKDARIYVFDRTGRLAGVSNALLGQTPGDGSAPEVGEHAQAGVVPVAERTTPAGRFASEPGLNLAGEHLVWVDYATALAIHRVRPGSSRQRRDELLASGKPSDNRVSLGCVVVPESFYNDVVEPLLGQRRGVVYVLPEERSARDIFKSL